MFAGDVRLLVELGELVAGQARWSELEQFVDLELAGTLVLGRTAATNRFCDAVRLEAALPVTLRLLEAGTLFVHQALMVLRKTRNCPEEVSRLVESRVLPACLGLCPADLGRRVEAEVLKVEGERERLDAEQRRAAAVRARRTFTRAEDDGMAVVGGYLPAEQARQWTLELEVLQRQEKAADLAVGVVRTADQRRADVLASLPGIVLAARAAGLVKPAGSAATGGTSGGAGDAGGAGGSAAGLAGAHGPAGVVAGCTRQRAPRILINVHVPMATVLDLAQAPGVMEGYGLISAEHVRGLLPAADLRAICVDEVGGRPISVGAVLRAGWDPTTGRLLTAPPPTSAKAAEAPPSRRSRRATEQREGPTSGRPGERCWPPPDSGGEDDGTNMSDAQGDEATERTDTERTDTERTGAQQADTAGTGATRERQPRRDPYQVRETLLAMIKPVWAVDRAERAHDPSAALSRLVDLRDQRCCGPGCSIPVGRTQRDHNLRWPQGPTATWNLSVKSARCHRAKHAGWQVTIDDGGAARWVSPLGRVYDRVAAWEAPPDLSRAHVLPAPRQPKSLFGLETVAEEDNPLSPYPLVGSMAPPRPSGSAEGPRGPEHGGDQEGEQHPGGEDPPPF